MTNLSKNITLATTSLRPVTNIIQKEGLPIEGQSPAQQQVGRGVAGGPQVNRFEQVFVAILVRVTLSAKIELTQLLVL